MRLTYIKEGLIKIKRSNIYGIGKSGSISKDIAIKLKLYKEHRKGHGAIF